MLRGLLIVLASPGAEASALGVLATVVVAHRLSCSESKRILQTKDLSLAISCPGSQIPYRRATQEAPGQQSLNCWSTRKYWSII